MGGGDAAPARRVLCEHAAEGDSYYKSTTTPHYYYYPSALCCISPASSRGCGRVLPRRQNHPASRPPSRPLAAASHPLSHPLAAASHPPRRRAELQEGRVCVYSLWRVRTCFPIPFFS